MYASETRFSNRSAREGARQEAVEILQPLLHELLTRARRHHETPLQEGMDGASIARAAWRSFVAGVADGEAWQGLTEEASRDRLSALVLRALQAEQPCQEAKTGIPWVGQPVRREGDGRAKSAGQPSERMVRVLGVWVTMTYTVLREVHPQALEILGLRVEGCTDREIALRLGLGLRLAQRLVRDAYQACERALPKE